ncbi:hypothetical protein [Helicobacter bizzozeronii]|uniref:hypothetical protein n=1 Tax=Helicobacter bizzozeronii TaxID=56877 RepID=UPI001F37A418|nr:hypothetical protein [Helicobacter bizzozeronii]
MCLRLVFLLFVGLMHASPAKWLSQMEVLQAKVLERYAISSDVRSRHGSRRLEQEPLKSSLEQKAQEIRALAQNFIQEMPLLKILKPNKTLKILSQAQLLELLNGSMPKARNKAGQYQALSTPQANLELFLSLLEIYQPLVALQEQGVYFLEIRQHLPLQKPKPQDNFVMGLAFKVNILRNLGKQTIKVPQSQFVAYGLSAELWDHPNKLQTYAPHDPKLDTSLKQVLAYQLSRSVGDIQDWGFYIDQVFDVDRPKTPQKPLKLSAIVQRPSVCLLGALLDPLSYQTCLNAFKEPPANLYHNLKDYLKTQRLLSVENTLCAYLDPKGKLQVFKSSNALCLALQKSFIGSL